METVIANTVNYFNEHSRHNMKIFVLGGSVDEKWLHRVNAQDYFLLCSTNESKAKRYLKCMFVAPNKIKEYNPDIILGADEKSVLFAKLFNKILGLRVKIGSWIHFSLTSISPFYHKVLKSADFHLAISEGLKNEYIKNKIAEYSHIYLVYNPLEIDHNLIPRPKDKTQYIYVGRLIYNGQKRVNDLLNALKQVTGEWGLTIIGDGKDKEKLVELADQLDINQKITWLGWKNEPFECIAEATALLLTSEYEGFGMVLVEAMSRGIPCISSNCPVGPSDIIKDGENGWLYPVGQIESLTEILVKINDGSMNLPDAEIVRQSVDKYDIHQFKDRIEAALKAELRK
nr:glycosyltransferase [Sporolactobacillus kofuensis]